MNDDQLGFLRTIFTVLDISVVHCPCNMDTSTAKVRSRCRLERRQSLRSRIALWRNRDARIGVAVIFVGGDSGTTLAATFAACDSSSDTIRVSSALLSATTTNPGSVEVLNRSAVCLPSGEVSTVTPFATGRLTL